MSFGLFELAILLFIVFLIMGPKRITNLFQALGRGVHDFVDTLGRDEKNELTEEEDPDRQLRKK
jgi:sec-independent protein translocase protein TatA